MERWGVRARWAPASMAELGPAWPFLCCCCAYAVACVRFVRHPIFSFYGLLPLTEESHRSVHFVLQAAAREAGGWCLCGRGKAGFPWQPVGLRSQAEWFSPGPRCLCQGLRSYIYTLLLGNGAFIFSLPRWQAPGRGRAPSSEPLASRGAQSCGGLSTSFSDSFCSCVTPHLVFHSAGLCVCPEGAGEGRGRGCPGPGCRLRGGRNTGTGVRRCITWDRQLQAAEVCSG